MAFECQEATEVDLSKYSLNSLVHNPLKEQLGPLRFAKAHNNREIKKSGSKKKVEESETLVPKSEFGCEKVSAGSVVHTLVTTDDGSQDYRRSITDLPSALISDIFNCLDPKELGIVSCVSTTLYKIASEHSLWKEFYCKRWGLPIAKAPNLGLADEKTWKELFVEREFRSKTFLGQYRPDFLSGHTEAVRTVFLLASVKLIFTAGYDSIVRIWDMEEGLSIASSRPLGCTIRAVAADTKLLIAGGTDGFILCWKSVEGVSHLFDLKGSQSQGAEFRLWEHEGPITCLALDLTRIYSGSWDMTVRIWDRALFKCVMVLRHSDWVWSIAPHNTTVASTSGSDVYIWNTSDGTLAAILPQAHEGNTNALAQSHTGDFLFTGGEDGSIHMFEITNSSGTDVILKVATWIPHSGPVNCIAFEFPWLVSASSDGKLALIDVRKLFEFRNQGRMKMNHLNQAIEPPQRMLHGSGSSLFCVDIGADRIVCGGEDCTVKVWDFSLALEKAVRSRAQRAIRLENRMRHRRLQTQMNCRSSRADKHSAAKKNSINGDRNSGVWHNKRELPPTGQVKA